jgi:uncharacterized SAM-binding protein YcdF (DUF218 family)
MHSDLSYFSHMPTSASINENEHSGSEIDRLAQILWDYNRLGQQPKKVDVILALGSTDSRVAERAGQLFLEGFAPLLVMSGGLGRFSKDQFKKSEAELFAEIAIKMGVHKDKILIESRSSNTGENIEFTKKLLADKGLDPKSFMVVNKPYMERRAYATFAKRWPGKEIVMASPLGTFAEHPTPALPKDKIINIMVGDTQRLREYPKRGFMIEQEIPERVWQAYERLVELGYDKQLIKE